MKPTPNRQSTVSPRRPDAPGLSAEPLTITASLAGAGEQFGRIARRFDLAVVGQAEPETGTIENIIAETTLFESGRPMIVVPYIQKARSSSTRSWCAGTAAARRRAPSVTRCRYWRRPDASRSSSLPTTPANRTRSRASIWASISPATASKSRSSASPRGDVDVADALLSHAADSGADFMVMGGYGHSRLREFVLGGVTRSILRSMTVPALMAH